jgi:peroxiredoxin Q/BCP
MLEAGAPAPTFELPNHEGEPTTLPDGTVLLYFYPRAGTRGCTRQARELRDRYEEFREREVTVVGVSTDPVAELREFREAESLPFTLVSDLDAEVARAYDSFGRVEHEGTSHEVAVRNSYLVRDGRILAAFEDVDPATHPETVLAALEEARDG